MAAALPVVHAAVGAPAALGFTHTFGAVPTPKSIIEDQVKSSVKIISQLRRTPDPIYEKLLQAIACNSIGLF